MKKNIFRQSLNEYLLADNVSEADGDMQQPQQGADPNMMGGQQMGTDPGMAPQGDPSAQGMDPNAQMPAPDMGAGGQMPPQGDPMQGMDPNAQMPAPEGQMPADGMDALPDAQMGNDGIEDIDMEGGVDTEQPGDEVIDVDQLTQSQEAAEYKIDGVDDKLTTLGAVVDKFIKALDQNNRKIDDLKAEFEKRNPTDEERINLRSQSSVPYMQTPKEYWDGVQERNPRYNVMTNNLVSPKDEQQEFELKKSDVVGGNDKEIFDSFDYPTNLKDILDF